MRKIHLIDVVSIATVLAVTIASLSYQKISPPKMRRGATVNLARSRAVSTTPKYQVIDLGTPSGTTFFAGIAASTNCKYVIGYAGNRSEGESAWQPVLWTKGNFSSLTYDEDYAVVRGVSDTGKVVGEIYSEDELPHAAVWERGKARRLFEEDSEISLALGADSDGNVFGLRLAPNSDNLRAFIRTAQGKTVYFHNKPGQDSLCLAANNQRQFLVYVFDHASESLRAMVWDKNGVRELPPLNTNQRSMPFSINDKGDIAGSCYTEQDSFLPVVWKNETPDLIPIPEMEEAVASRINDDGDIVGGVILKGQRAALPYLWKHDTFYNLNDILDNKASLTYPIQISNKGSIIVGGNVGREPHTFLLQPERK